MRFPLVQIEDYDYYIDFLYWLKEHSGIELTDRDKEIVDALLEKYHFFWTEDDEAYMLDHWLSDYSVMSKYDSDLYG